ncbi:hypothetical protein G7076_10170 [Sphingomonas sp. HDW15A]|uniref:hypothetical protein n=1 Tax=Sphingomonas sp. HDW15A TaxID=2714942 RepID=UPI00140C5C35|nr:hypothetical protein [Sphingomonas sp. HDW15A]QIK96752.1 hypothetical protein G7076_10170 [Sphingomonas sp. HDW15A]
MDDDSEIEREIRQGRKFNPQDALAKMAGPGAMKGASPVSPVRQAELEIGTWLKLHVPDTPGALQLLLHRQVKGSPRLLEDLDHPLAALRIVCEEILASEYRLAELVREADMEWGRAVDERPHFDRPCAKPDPDDPYTLEGVRQLLTDIVGKLSGAAQGEL